MLIPCSPASAGVWNWGCKGRLGDQRILFDYSRLTVADDQSPPGAKASSRPPAFTTDTIGSAIRALREAKQGITEFEPAGGIGLDSPPVFTRTDANKKTWKVTFTEKSSRRTFHKHELICGRDEDTDFYSKLYRYEREGEPARDIAMQCYEYQLSTRGGRKGCDD